MSNNKKAKKIGTPTAGVTNVLYGAMTPSKSTKKSPKKTGAPTAGVTNVLYGSMKSNNSTKKKTKKVTRFKKANGSYYLKDKNGKWVKVSASDYNLASSSYGPGIDATISNARARKKRQATSGNSNNNNNNNNNNNKGNPGKNKETITSKKQSTTTHQSSNTSGSNGGDNVAKKRTSKVTGYGSDSIDFTHDSTSMIMIKIKRKYNQIFLARDHMGDFNNLQDTISVIESFAKTLRKYKEDYDDTNKADEAKVYTIDGVSQIPKWIDKALEYIDVKGSKTSALYNLKSSAKKFVASYYRKEYDDCIRYGEYCDIAIRQCNSNILAKKKGDWDSVISQIRSWKSKGNSRAKEAKKKEANARNSLYKDLFAGRGAM